jgi:hypothetical protein
MVKIVHAYLYKRFADPLPNLDPEGNLHFGVYDLIICRRCLGLYGRLVRELPPSPEGKRRSGWRRQKCKCQKAEDKENGIVTLKWPGNDFNTSVEFCHCCSKALINTGSKFSSFYCCDCLAMVEEHNNHKEKMQIPYGRHSFMNDIKLGSPWSKQEENEFSVKVNGFFKKLDLVWEWQQLCLFQHLHELGFRFRNDISLPYFDSLVPNLKSTKADLFKSMVEYLNNGMYKEYIKGCKSYEKQKR